MKTGMLPLSGRPTRFLAAATLKQKHEKQHYGP